MRDGQNPYEMQADILKAMGHPLRLQIVRHLGNGEQAVSEIVKVVGSEQSNVSRHLALLRQAGVLACRKDGLRVFYRLASASLVEALGCVFDCVNKLARSRLEASESMLARTEESESAPPPAGGGD